MTPATTHPLAAAWLRDLELLLHGVDPGERAEVLAGVHEHLDASLRRDASEDDVRRVLTELGSPQSVADEAYAGRPATVVVPSPRRPASPWTAVLATAGNAFALLLLLPLVTFGISAASSLLFAFPVFVLPWLVVCVLTAMSARWNPREKAISALVIPTTVVAVTLVIGIMMALIGPHPVNLVPTLAVLGAALCVLVRLGRSALR
ncbi:hypothetical protein GCM10022415_04900 [Knoellia locipacati]|uniref:DUF1700 domain-containing protein n=1 Tax=Knoellia locipacati TaxID=882824 RepID=A0A512SWW9_9MICO|nr:DUF1700 domain-containing protein [Knoellia locipacati]GEQ12441.1 hypothetical protein KLO01_04880 [Knoellia locipacati]